jgi:hypothetical protein
MKDKRYLDQALEAMDFEEVGEYEETIGLWATYGGD